MAVSKITYEFEYAIPDKYLYNTTDLGLTAKFTYKGASRFWVMVDKNTNKIEEIVPLLCQNDIEKLINHDK